MCLGNRPNASFSLANLFFSLRVAPCPLAMHEGQPRCPFTVLSLRTGKCWTKERTRQKPKTLTRRQHTNGCGSKSKEPFWGRCTTHSRSPMLNPFFQTFRTTPIYTSEAGRRIGDVYVICKCMCMHICTYYECIHAMVYI